MGSCEANRKAGLASGAARRKVSAKAKSAKSWVVPVPFSKFRSLLAKLHEACEAGAPKPWLKLPARAEGTSKEARRTNRLREVVRLMRRGKSTHPERNRDRVSFEVIPTGNLLKSIVVRFLQSPRGLGGTQRVALG